MTKLEASPQSCSLQRALTLQSLWHKSLVDETESGLEKKKKKTTEPHGDLETRRVVKLVSAFSWSLHGNYTANILGKATV